VHPIKLLHYQRFLLNKFFGRTAHYTIQSQHSRWTMQEPAHSFFFCTHSVNNHF
jgi:hypothetical protein